MVGTRVKAWFASKRSKKRILKVVRRVHLYAGLFLLPWLMFFGVSGILFNHPNVGEDVVGRRVSPADIEQATSLAPWPASQVGRDVVAYLNQHGVGRYDVDADFDARYSGLIIFKAPSADGQHTFLFEPQSTRGILATRKARPEGPAAPFSKTVAKLPQYNFEGLDTQVAGLMEHKSVVSKGPLRAQDHMAPKVEFRMRDAEGTRWNVTYDLATGEVDGRRTDQFPSVGISQLFAKLHTTHHFTLGLRAQWFWALFEDLLGLAMVLWALTGLFMWWQLKPTRTIGIAVLLASLGLAGAIMAGTAAEILFGNVEQVLGPGEEP